jgi:hypothetical protein
MTPYNCHGEYLRDCLREFPSICKLKYGVEFDLAAVEEKVRHLRRRTPLTYSDLEYFESPKHWWFKQFWVFPPRERIEAALQKETFDFWNLPESNEAETIRKLLHIFKSIELVSIILRFIRPEHYSIYSAPIQHMLDIRHGRDLVETYRTYVDNMRGIEKHLGFVRVADVDMALWVLHEKCFGRHQDPAIAEAYRNDDFMLQLRVNNLVAPLAELSEARLARALVAVKPALAILIACHYFEVLIRKLADQFHLSESDSTLDETIDAIPNYGPVDPVRKALWKALKTIRNELIHHDKLPGPRESQLLIEEVDKLESEINAGIVENSPASGRNP